VRTIQRFGRIDRLGSTDKEDTVNLQPYKDTEIDYEEVAIIKVIVEKEAKVDRIAEIIQIKRRLGYSQCISNMHIK
jgi:hypothetical protein